MGRNKEQSSTIQEQILEFARSIGATPEDLDGASRSLQAEIRSTTHERVAATNPVVQPAVRRTTANLPAPIEPTSEILVECLAGLEKDYRRGIVVVDDTKGVKHFQTALREDKTAGMSWEAIKEKLEANGGKLLKKTAQLQGRGTLIGIYPDGKLCIKDRGNEPVIHATLAGRQIEITTDTPNRNELMQRVGEEGQFADYWEIRDAVCGKGLELPPDSPSYEKKGLIAAVEAVTNEDFVRSANGEKYRSAVLECGDVPTRSSRVRVVGFDPRDGGARVDDDYPRIRGDYRGAVRVLRG